MLVIYIFIYIYFIFIYLYSYIFIIYNASFIMYSKALIGIMDQSLITKEEKVNRNGLSHRLQS